MQQCGCNKSISISILIRSAVSMERCKAIMHREVVHWRLPGHSQQYSPVVHFFWRGEGGMNLSKTSMTAVPHPPSSSHPVQCNFSFLKLKLALRGNIFYGNNKLHIPVSKHRSSKNATNNVMINGLMPSRNNGTTSSRITWNIG